jgi:hypothetical protein
MNHYQYFVTTARANKINTLTLLVVSDNSLSNSLTNSVNLSSTTTTFYADTDVNLMMRNREEKQTNKHKLGSIFLIAKHIANSMIFMIVVVN